MVIGKKRSITKYDRQNRNNITMYGGGPVLNQFGLHRPKRKMRQSKRVIDTNNNANGYIVHLNNLTHPNTYYYHYKCIYKYFIQIILSASPYKSPDCATVLDRDDIDMLLNIDNKIDAALGTGFY